MKFQNIYNRLAGITQNINILFFTKWFGQSFEFSIIIVEIHFCYYWQCFVVNGCKVWFNVSSEKLHLYCFNYHFKYLDFKHQHHHPNRIMWLSSALFPRYIKFASHFERMASHLQHCNISKICIPFCVTCRTSCILLIMNLNFKFIGCTPFLHIEWL